MKPAPKIGSTGEFAFTLGPDHNITFATDSMPAVLSTPNLIGLIERLARDDQELIAHGLHDRAEIRVDSCARRLERNSQTRVSPS